jgi:hypothetical protein
MRRIFAGLLALLMVLGAAPPGWAGSSSPPAPADTPAPADPEAQADAQEATPPRVSYLHGDVSFWRPGAADWAPAALNMPLAPGDVLYTGPAGNVEIQIGPRAFARAAYGAQIGLDNQEPDFIQLRVTSGYAALDLRELAPGHTVELDTPGAAFTMERAGYYHAEIGPDATAFRTYRGGSAVMTPSGGTATPVAANQQVTIAGGESPRVEAAAAPTLTAWDRWNYQRTDYLAQPASAKQVPAGVYGAEALDQHGTWRTVETYGSVWVPAAVAPGWSPYSTGRWIWDPRFGWTWLDDAPWGWAPYHHGRWVFVGPYWAWAPGPILVRPVYSPALVVFLGGPVVVGRPLYWAPLGWGEPCLPWWGPRGFVGEPHWLGWGGPRVVNQVVIKRKVVVHADGIHEWENARRPGGFVAVNGKSFGRKPVERERLTDVAPDKLVPLHGSPPTERAAESFSGSPEKVRPPPKQALERRVVATRQATEPAVVNSAPEPRLVPPPHGDSGPRKSFKRTPFGSALGEERAVPEPPPRFEEIGHGGAPKLREPKLPHVEGPKLPKPAPMYVPPQSQPQLELPGQPANRVYRGHSLGGGGGEGGGGGGEYRGRDLKTPRSPTSSSDPAGLLPGAPPLRSR